MNNLWSHMLSGVSMLNPHEASAYRQRTGTREGIIPASARPMSPSDEAPADASFQAPQVVRPGDLGPGGKRHGALSAWATNISNGVRDPNANPAAAFAPVAGALAGRASATPAPWAAGMATTGAQLARDMASGAGGGSPSSPESPSKWAINPMTGSFVPIWSELARMGSQLRPAGPSPEMPSPLEQRMGGEWQPPSQPQSHLERRFGFQWPQAPTAPRTVEERFGVPWSPAAGPQGHPSSESAPQPNIQQLLMLLQSILGRIGGGGR